MTTSAAVAPAVGDIPDRLYRRLARRLLPIVGLCYAVAVIDRTNIGYAKLQMSADIRLSAAAYGLGAGIFFAAYCLLEVPSNLILERVGARVWLTRILITWGLITVLTGFVQNETQFYLARIALGAAEAGLYPGLVLFLARWFPRPRLTRALALLVVAGPLASIAVGPLSGWIMSALDTAAGLAGWQWLFFVEGVPAIVLGVVFYAFMVDSPQRSRWLGTDDRMTLEAAIAAHDAAAPSDSARHGKFGTSVRDGRVWLLGVAMAASYLGIYAVVFWMPTMLQASGLHSLVGIGLVSSIPWAAAVVVIIATGSYSDRTHRHRSVAAGSLVLAAVGLVISVVSGRSVAPVLIGLTLAAATFSAVGPLLWAVAHDHLRGSIAIGASIALINTVGSLGSFLGPYIAGLGVQWTGSVETPMLCIAAAGVLTAGVLSWRRTSAPSRPGAVADVPVAEAS